MEEADMSIGSIISNLPSLPVVVFCLILLSQNDLQKQILKTKDLYVRPDPTFYIQYQINGIKN